MASLTLGEGRLRTSDRATGATVMQTATGAALWEGLYCPIPVLGDAPEGQLGLNTTHPVAGEGRRGGGAGLLSYREVPFHSF